MHIRYGHHKIKELQQKEKQVLNTYLLDEGMCDLVGVPMIEAYQIQKGKGQQRKKKKTEELCNPTKHVCVVDVPMIEGLWEKKNHDSP